MRLLAAAASVLALAACGSGSGSTAPSTAAPPATTAPPSRPAASFGAMLIAPTHTPKANTKWRYEVRATRHGRPVRARLTAQVVDPLGGVHPVLYANTKRKLVNWRFHGSFHDFAIWPGSARGITLTFRVTVAAGGATRVLRYRVTPR